MLLLMMLSLPIVVGWWARNWEYFPPLQAGDITRFQPQALVVIGGGVNKAVEYDTPRTVNAGTLLRIRYAARLAREFGLPVLASGGCVFGPECIPEAQLIADVLEMEFNTRVAWLEANSRNTAENARFSARELQDYNIKRIVLVSQAYHMPRAVLEFRKAGLEVLPAPTAFISGDISELTIFDFVPSAAALMDSYLLAHETLGMLWYRLRY